MKKTVLLLIILLCIGSCVSDQKEDQIMIRKIFDEVLLNGECYKNLEVLCNGIGPRLSGSEASEKAVRWGRNRLSDLGLDRVYLQEVMVPHWERGEPESAIITSDKGVRHIPEVCALGGSVATTGSIEAGVIEANDFKELEALGKQKVEGKFVFFNRPMNPTFIDTFEAYEHAVDQRVNGAIEAAKYGAKGVLIRSMSLSIDHYPHTGTMRYDEQIKKIPAAALSTKDAEFLSKLLKMSTNVKIALTMNCRMIGDIQSHNVIGEIKGTKYPERIIVVSGHIDSWDNSPGAHDDGAGIVQSIEVLRILKTIKYKPNNTVRAVLYMNEENGNKGGKTYAGIAGENNEKHVAAIESDSGGFTPRGFTVDGPAKKVKKIQGWASKFKPYNLHIFEKGFGGVDIGPLKKVDDQIPLIGLNVDSQRYFDFHHAASDTFETVNKRELELGAGSMAALVYLIDKYGL